VNARIAFRLVHGWSQPRAADEWNKRWPADPKTFKNFSYWEVWPAPTGHAPSLDVLARLAELYDCCVADLLADCGDFRHNDSEYQAEKDLAQLRDVVAGKSTSAVQPLSASESRELPGDRAEDQQLDPVMAFIEKVREMSAEDIAHTAAAWAHGLKAD
jgi:hypothetical protein